MLYKYEHAAPVVPGCISFPVHVFCCTCTSTNLTYISLVLYLISDALPGKITRVITNWSRPRKQLVFALVNISPFACHPVPKIRPMGHYWSAWAWYYEDSLPVSRVAISSGDLTIQIAGVRVIYIAVSASLVPELMAGSLLYQRKLYLGQLVSPPLFHTSSSHRWS